MLIEATAIQAQQAGGFGGFIFIILIWAIIIALAYLLFYKIIYKTIYVKIIKRYLDIREREADARIESLKKDKG